MRGPGPPEPFIERKSMNANEALPPGTLIDDLHFPTRIYNCLKQHNIHTINQLTSCTDDELLDIPGIGTGRLSEVKRNLAEHGLALRRRPKSWCRRRHR